MMNSVGDGLVSGSPASTTPRQQRPVVVGLDFGTHSTKVVIRERAEKIAKVQQIEESTVGYPWFASPSLVCIENGKVYFGRDASIRKGGILIRSLKVDLLSALAGQKLPTGLYPDFLVACYLAWVLQSIREQLRSSGDPPIALNVAAPMSHGGSAALKHRYLEVINAAWTASYGDNPFKVTNGIELDKLREFFMPIFDERVPDRGERPFEVHAETCASIVSLSQNPQMAPGMYMIIDMGAGTTEFSMNLVNEPGADQRVACYDDESDATGGDILEAIDALPVHIGDVQRDAKLTHIAAIYRRVWSKGYRKDSQNRWARARWRHLTVLLCGGGTRRIDVKQAIANTNPLWAWPPNDPGTRIDIKDHEPLNIDWNSELHENIIARDASFITVAHGLSIERQRWPIVFVPNDVESLDQAESYEHNLGFVYEGK